MRDAPITAINCFEVPGERVDQFLAIWQKFHDLQQQQPGFRANRMYRAADENTRFRFVNVIEWDSEPLYEQATTGDRFQQLVVDAGPAWDEFTRVYGRFTFVADLSTDMHGANAMQRRQP